MGIFARRIARRQIPLASGVDPTSDAGALAIGAASYAIPWDAIYVATTGSDTAGNGTQANPYATLSKAYSSAAIGGTLVFRAGEYNEGTDTQSGSLTQGFIFGKSVIVQNYPGEAVWFDGSVVLSSDAFTASGSVWWAPYDRLYDRSPTDQSGAPDGDTGGNGASGTFVDPAYPCASYPDMVFYDGSQLTQVATQVEVGPGKFFIEGVTTTGYWFQGSKVWIGDDPNGHEIRYANKTRLAAVTGDSVTLRGIGIRRYAPSQCTYGCLFVGSSGTGLLLENIHVNDIACSFVWLCADNPTLTKVTARRIGGNIIGTNLANNIMLDRLDLQGANYANYAIAGPNTAAIKVCKCFTVTLKNSIVSNNNTTGFWTDQTVDSPCVYSCAFQNNINRGVDFELSYNSVLANCKFTDCGGQGTYINDANKTRIWNCVYVNTMYKNYMGGAPIDVGQSVRRSYLSAYSYGLDSRAPAGYYDDPEHQWQNNSFEIYNCIFSRPGSGGTRIFNCESANDSSTPARKFQPDFNPVMNSNIYHWTAQPQYPWVATNGYNLNPTVYFSLANFKSATNLESKGLFATTDPLDANYQLTNTTLHASNGTGLPGDIAALIGQAAGTLHIGTFW